jgi:hypothetical protein
LIQVFDGRQFSSAVCRNSFPALCIFQMTH